MIEEGIVLVAVMIIVEVIKKVTEGKHNKILPLVALLLGVIAQATYNGFTVDNIFAGVLIGGAAAGVYDVVNKTILDK